MVEFYEEQQRLKDERISLTQGDWGKQRWWWRPTVLRKPESTS
jgi:hypothetical protein